MLKWLLPQETDFFSYFEEHSKLITQGAEELLKIVSNDSPMFLSLERIRQLEHQADDVTHQCVEALHKTFITPFQRDDIHRLISKMDDVIDYIHDAMECLVIYQLHTMTEEIKEFAGILVKAAKELEKIIIKLRNYQHLDEMKKLMVNIHMYENEADRVYLEAKGRLLNDFTDPRLIIKWKEIYENLENAIDRCEDVTNIIEGVILESN